MTTYVFTLSDKTPSVEIDVKETAIAQGAAQDLYDRARKELGYTGTFVQFLASFKGDKGDTGAKGDTGWRTLTISSKLGNSYLKVRRKNDTVMYQFGGLSWGWFGIVRRGGPGYAVQPSDRERNVFILGLNGIPQGFKSEFSLIGGIYNDKGTPYGTWYLGGPADRDMLRFQFVDPVPTDRDIGDIRVSPIMYLTNDPWPTRLP